MRTKYALGLDDGGKETCVGIMHACTSAAMNRLGIIGRKVQPDSMCFHCIQYLSQTLMKTYRGSRFCLPLVNFNVECSYYAIVRCLSSLKPLQKARQT
eukprot:5182964-Amphidinium_carterae.1